MHQIINQLQQLQQQVAQVTQNLQNMQSQLQSVTGQVQTKNAEMNGTQRQASQPTGYGVGRQAAGNFGQGVPGATGYGSPYTTVNHVGSSLTPGFQSSGQSTAVTQNTSQSRQSEYSNFGRNFQ